MFYVWIRLDIRKFVMDINLFTNVKIQNIQRTILRRFIFNYPPLLLMGFYYCYYYVLHDFLLFYGKLNIRFKFY